MSNTCNIFLIIYVCEYKEILAHLSAIHWVRLGRVCGVACTNNPTSDCNVRNPHMLRLCIDV